ncbi:glycosyltransferase family 2 protein [Porcincola sp. LCP21S3_C12]|uniref:glycosyltransferase family 2 protein n=1 Tax=Porcincola sp. LCP21S3_C12 TaxID=3438798 RepID=UPI003F96A111
MKKTISILIPCFNEQENVIPISEALTNLFREKLPEYQYEIVFIDNDSQDKTRTLLREICGRDKRIKAIFNAKNFGQFNSPYYGMMQTSGDCTILLCCDFQDPIDLIPEMVREWEKGYKLVVMQKKQSKESKMLYFLRSCYYKLIKKMSQVNQIEQFTGFGLYDKSFIQIMRELKDSTPFLRGIVAELGYKIKFIPYTQEKRRAGKTHNNFASLYDAAMLSFTTYTKGGLRLATFLGFGSSVVCIVLAIVFLVLKLVFWNRFNAGMAPLLIGMFFIGSVMLFFLGIMGEYILSINQRILGRPLVIEEERLNFDHQNTIK